MADLVVLVMGNICAGKSTFVDYVEKNKDLVKSKIGLGVNIFPEFLDPVWREEFYEDRKDNTYGFELDCLSSRIARHRRAKRKKDLFIFDRGMIEGGEIFAYNSYREGYLKRREFLEYEERLFDALDELDRTKEDVDKWLEKLIIYLEVKDPNILVRRNKQRAQEQGVEVVPADYLKRINDRYTHVVNNIHKIYDGKYAVPVPEVLRIDASQDMNRNGDYHAECLNLMLDKIKLMQN
ncbi:deoxynucleoside kinase [archaeon]|jgi:deoxyadenosine/deoxycytidine kinase|nr:deoxynucleoside kinase [archaeon]MBT3450583.1 deoxynucleoside kinase [archaeon]MBT6868437.1 deoxynucleoside kinase [archaeon]MBT7193536.1 deoxynucleoside kinase [archaeon]MBT7381269.1 deoxynucleoside kinase [archaeon]